MKRQMKYFLIFLLLLSSKISAQTNMRPDRITKLNITQYEQGHTFGNLSGYGFSSLLSSSFANIGSVNPSYIADFTKAGFGISYQADSDLALVCREAGITGNRVSSPVPQSAGFVLPYKNLRLGAAVNFKYNMEWEYTISNFYYPEPGMKLNRTYTPVSKQYIIDQSITFAYIFNKAFTGSGRFIPSFRMHRQSLSYKYKLNEEREEIDGFVKSTSINSYVDKTIYNWSAGFIYDLNFNKGKILKFGMSYSRELNFEHLYYFKTVNTIQAPPNIKSYFTGHIPTKLNSGLFYEISKKLRFSGSLDYIYWSEIPSEYQPGSNSGSEEYEARKYLENQIWFSAGLIYRINKNTDISAGFYKSDIRYKDEYKDYNYYDFHNDNYIPVDRNMKRLFLTAGLNFKFSSYEIDIAVADSHLGSDDTAKQTICKMALGYNF